MSCRTLGLLTLPALGQCLFRGGQCDLIGRDAEIALLGIEH
jgi:hypothetical protein